MIATFIGILTVYLVSFIVYIQFKIFSIKMLRCESGTDNLS